MCMLVQGYGSTEIHKVIRKAVLRWTDTGSRIMADILFLITYHNVQKSFQICQIGAFNNFPAHFGRISARGDEIFENSN